MNYNFPSFTNELYDCTSPNSNPFKSPTFASAPSNSNSNPVDTVANSPGDFEDAIGYYRENNFGVDGLLDNNENQLLSDNNSMNSLDFEYSVLKEKNNQKQFEEDFAFTDNQIIYHKTETKKKELHKQISEKEVVDLFTNPRPLVLSFQQNFQQQNLQLVEKAGNQNQIKLKNKNKNKIENKNWTLYQSNTNGLIEVENIDVELKSREQSYGSTIPNNLYSSIQYTIFPRININYCYSDIKDYHYCTTLEIADSESNAIIKTIKDKNLINFSQSDKNKKKISLNRKDENGVLSIISPKLSNSPKIDFVKFKFNSTCYHYHKNSPWKFIISIYLLSNKNKNNNIQQGIKVATIESPNFMVKSRRPSKEKRKKNKNKRKREDFDGDNNNNENNENYLERKQKKQKIFYTKKSEKPKNFQQQLNDILNILEKTKGEDKDDFQKKFDLTIKSIVSLS